MNLQTYAYEAPGFAESTSFTQLRFREIRQRSVIIAGGALSEPGTSSAKPNRVWKARSFESGTTASGIVWKEAATITNASQGEATRRAISELRRVSGLTWEQLGELFEVSRRSVHFWASGKPLNAANEKRLMRVLDIVRLVDKGDARSTRAALFEVRDGWTAFALLAVQRFEDAQELLGAGAGRRRPALAELSAAAKAARAPMPPEELINAQHDRVHRDPGRARAARTVRNTKRGPA